MRWKTDLHNHTSEDKYDHYAQNAQALVYKAHSLGFHAIAITLHEQQDDLPKAVELGEELGILVIPGIELTLLGHHVLALGLPTQEANAIKTPEDLTQARLRHGGAMLTIAPHPFYPVGFSLRKKFWEWHPLFDAVEISRLNSRLTSRFNNQAEAAAQKLGLPILANSDSHLLPDFGSCYTIVEGEEDPLTKENLFRRIREGRVDPVCPHLSEPALALSIWNQLFHGLTHRPKPLPA